MKFLKILAIIIAVILIAMLVFLPSKLDIKKSVIIDAPVEVVFAQVEDLKNWTAWSPWEKLDPNMNKTYSDNTKGLNAKLEWTSEMQEVGNGSMVLSEVVDNKKIITTMTMEGEDGGSGGFDFEEVEGGTKITWYMYQEYSTFQLASRFFTLLFESMVAEQFVNGLNDIKEIAENIEVVPYSLNISEVETEDQFIIAIKDSSSTNSEEISAAFGKCFTDIMAFINENEITPSGMPLSIANEWNPEENKYVFEVGMPIADNKLKTKDNIYIRTLKGGKMVLGEQIGAYSGAEKSYNSIMEYIDKNDLETIGFPYEVYANDPGEVPEAELKTLIYFPVSKKNQ